MLKLVFKHINLGIVLCVCTINSYAAYWSAQELRTLASFQLSRLETQPSKPSNKYAYNANAAAFGKQLFFDTRFSLNNSLSCATCHQPNKGFTDGLTKAKGVHQTGRNTQTLLGATHQRWFYWDGRKDSLWSQALIPFEAANEMASSRVSVLRKIGNDTAYRKQYESLFGEFPEIILKKHIPNNAGPWGEKKTRNNWYRISPTTQKIINRAYANIGKAIAAYEHTIALPQTKFDQFLNVLFSKNKVKANKMLAPSQLKGIKLFINQNKTHCLRCHNGPMLTNGGFHNIGTGNFTGKQLDFGRFIGIQAVTQDEFNCLGQYSDAKTNDCLSLRFLSKQVHAEMQGAYKSPTLRYLNKTPPYFHDGRFNQLEQVINHYTNTTKGKTELPELKLTSDEKKSLIEFLHLLDALD